MRKSRRGQLALHTDTSARSCHQVIDDHGGTHANDIEVGVTTHLVTSQAEVDKTKKSARLKLVRPPMCAACHAR